MTDSNAPGVTAIDIQVDDVPAATKLLSEAYGAGAELLQGPLTTDWGTQAAHLRGPGNLIVDVCRDA